MGKKIAFIIGTRPEGIKLAPVIHYAKNHFCGVIEPIVIATGQHTELLTEVFSFFNIIPEHSLKIVRKNHLLSELQAQLTQSLEQLFEKIKPDIVMVQGDTISTLSGAMAAFYQQIPIAYVESGLRSGELYSPFPEEANRLMTTKLSKWHFTPTENATNALKKEYVVKNIYQVGNTVVDAIQYAKNIGFSNRYSQHEWIKQKKDGQKMILVTIHRRETWASQIDEIIQSIQTISKNYSNQIDIVWITHANPNLSKKINEKLDHISNIFIYPPANYAQLLHLMSHAYIILTDSGGIQEESPSMNVPVLVARNVSERMEGIESGCAKLVGTNSNKIVKSISQLIDNPSEHTKMTGVPNPYGDGKSSQRILEILTSS